MYHGGERNLIRYAQLAEHMPHVGVHGVRRDVQPLTTAFLKRAIADARALTSASAPYVGQTRDPKHLSS
jgi:hypothetical protein